MKKPRMTEEKFDKIKNLIGLKLTNKQIEQLETVSYGTIARIRTNTWESYQEGNRKWAETQRMKKQERLEGYSAKIEAKEEKTVSPKDFDQHNSIVALLRAIESNQTRQNELLAELVGKKKATFWSR